MCTEIWGVNYHQDSQFPLYTDLIGSQEVDSEQRQDQNSEYKEKKSKEDAILY